MLDMISPVYPTILASIIVFSPFVFLVVGLIFYLSVKTNFFHLLNVMRVDFGILNKADIANLPESGICELGSFTAKITAKIFLGGVVIASFSALIIMYFPRNDEFFYLLGFFSQIFYYYRIIKHVYLFTKNLKEKYLASYPNFNPLN